MPAHFVLKRYLEGFEEYGDLYEAIKSGRKKVEYRDATDHWATRLLNPDGKTWFNNLRDSGDIEFNKDYLKHDKAVFVVGYTKHPKLVADITKIVYRRESNQFETHIKNVRQNPCIVTDLECTKKYDCENCIVFLVGYYKAKESILETKKRTNMLQEA